MKTAKNMIASGLRYLNNNCELKWKVLCTESRISSNAAVATRDQAEFTTNTTPSSIGEPAALLGLKGWCNLQ